MRVVLIFLALIFAIAIAQKQVDRLTIDDFEEGNNDVLIILSAAIPVGGTPITDVSIFTSANGATDTSILGGERDLQYTAQTGLVNRVFSSSVSVVDGSGEWEISTPNNGTGVVLMQYDSLDNNIALDTDGFLKITGTSSGLDLTEGGLGKSFHTVIEADVGTTYAINVYSPNGNKCTNSKTVPKGNVPLDSVVPFTQFSGNCDFDNVGAIEIVVQAVDSVDVVVSVFTTQGDEDPSNPSPSRTRSPGASAAPPSPSSSPAVVSECFCQCPAFTCELIFDVDDDDNHALFFVDDDGFELSRGYFGGYGYYYANGEGKSDATTLVASFATILAVFVGFF